MKVLGKCWLSMWFLVSLVLLQVNAKQIEQTNLPSAFVMNWLKSSGFSIEPSTKRGIREGSFYFTFVNKESYESDFCD